MNSKSISFLSSSMNYRWRKNWQRSPSSLYVFYPPPWWFCAQSMEARRAAFRAGVIAFPPFCLVRSDHSLGRIFPSPSCAGPCLVVSQGTLWCLRLQGWFSTREEHIGVCLRWVEGGAVGKWPKGKLFPTCPDPHSLRTVLVSSGSLCDGVAPKGEGS